MSCVSCKIFKCGDLNPGFTKQKSIRIFTMFGPWMSMVFMDPRLMDPGIQPKSRNGWSPSTLHPHLGDKPGSQCVAEDHRSSCHNSDSSIRWSIYIYIYSISIMCISWFHGRKGILEMSGVQNRCGFEMGLTHSVLYRSVFSTHRKMKEADRRWRQTCC